jgi:mono/diheme cytochrome c family protein
MRKRYLIPIGVVLAILVLLAALVAVSCGGSATTTTTAAVSTTTGATTGGIDAAALFASNCAGCHKKVPGGSADEVKTVVEAGKEDMPSFNDKLTADEIAALVTYVTSGGN